jgi:hypothetical protein
MGIGIVKPIHDAGSPESGADRRHRNIQILGIGQALSAISTLFLLVARGLDRLTIGAAALTVLLTAVSTIFFGGRPSRRRM